MKRLKLLLTLCYLFTGTSLASALVTWSGFVPGCPVTTIERDANSVPKAILAPDGQRTTLTVNANGYLTMVPARVGWKT